MLRSPIGQLALIILLVVGLGCGENGEDVLIYSGNPGTAVPIRLFNWVPTLSIQVEHATIKSSDTKLMLVDTGAPLTGLDKNLFPKLSLGSQPMTIKAFGMTFPSYPAVVMSLFSDDSSPCEESGMSGLVGGDLLRFFRFGLDYQGKKSVLFDGPDADGPVSQQTESPQQISIELLGGGLASIDSDVPPVKVSATRIIVKTVVEGKETTAIVDTGASFTIVSRALFNSLSKTGRPELCCEYVATAYGSTKATVTRVKELDVGQTRVKNLPIMVFEDNEVDQHFFQSLTAEVGRELSMIVGGSFLRHFAVYVDYQRQSMELGRYKIQSHISNSEFVGPGFSFCKGKKTDQTSEQNQSGMVVGSVYQGSDAEKKGIQPLSILIAVDGQSVLDMTEQEVKALFQKMAVGSTTRLTFKGTPNDVDVDLLVEQLLPNMP